MLSYRYRKFITNYKTHFMEHTKPSRSKKKRIPSIYFEVPVNGRTYEVQATPFEKLERSGEPAGSRRRMTVLPIASRVGSIGPGASRPRRVQHGFVAGRSGFGTGRKKILPERD